MKRIISLILVYLISVGNAAAAAFTAKATGNWSSGGQTTWTQVGVPGNGDTVNINGFTVTVDTATTVGASGNGIMGYVVSAPITSAGTLGSGNCSITFSGGSFIRPARATCTLSGGGVATVTMTQRGMYLTGTAPTCAFAATGLTGALCGPLVTNTDFIPGDGVAAIATGTTGVLNIAAGIPLTLRGALSYTTGAATDFATMQAGSSIAFDSHLAVNTPIYTVGPDTSAGTRRFNASGCTAIAPCSITSVAGGLNGALISGAEPSGNIIARNVAFSKLGDSLSFGIYTDENNGSTVKYDVQSSTFANMGEVYILNAGTNGTVIHANNTHSKTVNNMMYPSAASGSLGTGTRQITNNVFDKRFAVGDDGVGATSLSFYTVQGNYFGDWLDMFGSSNLVTTGTNFYHYLPNTTQVTDWTPTGTSINDYFQIDWNLNNPHFVSMRAVAYGWQGTFWEQTIPSSGITGVCAFPLATNPASPISQTWTNNIELPTMLGNNACEFTDTQASPANRSFAVTNNTYVGGSDRSTGPVAVNEVSPALAGALTAMKYNLAWANTGYDYTMIFNDDCTTGGTQDVGSPGNVNFNYSDSKRVLTKTCTGSTNQGKGYVAKWSVTPGANDIIDALINYADNNRTVALFNTKYLGETGTPWSGSSVAYHEGDFVSNVNANVYKGVTVLYRAIADNTSAALTEPGVGANWQTVWEWKGLYTLRLDITTNKTYVDGAIPGCTQASPCGPLLARENWIRRGYTPQDPRMRIVGLAAAGAVDMDMIFVPTMGQ